MIRLFLLILKKNWLVNIKFFVVNCGNMFLFLILNMLMMLCNGFMIVEEFWRG